MTLSAEDLIKVMEKAKELGVSAIKVEGLEASFGASIPAAIPTTHHVEDMKPEELYKAASPLDEISEEEVLYWSSPYYDEMQSKKAEHKRVLEEEAKERA